MTGQENNPGPTRISVVIPVFNGSKYIAQAISSVRANEYADIEIVVVDDGSTDDTAIVIDQSCPDVRYIHQENAGTGAARNYGVRESTGEFIAFLDADDLWTQQKLALQVSAFASDSNLDVVWGHVQEFTEDQNPEESAGRPLAGQHPGAALFRADALRNSGGFSIGLRNAEVVEWVSRITTAGLQQLMLPEVVMYRRLHTQNKGRDNPAAHREYLLVLKRHLDRRRS
ncbi:MAG: glycosyltransferase involved in cell wall biosynthesis [Halioglobus sp.]|jgi:glycosyltransferase involved in cell wall biosynthesis